MNLGVGEKHNLAPNKEYTFYYLGIHLTCIQLNPINNYLSNKDILLSHIKKVWRCFVPTMVHWYEDITKNVVSFHLSLCYLSCIWVFSLYLSQDGYYSSKYYQNTLPWQFIGQN